MATRHQRDDQLCRQQRLADHQSGVELWRRRAGGRFYDAERRHRPAQHRVANTPTIGFTEAGGALSGTLTVAAGGITDTLTLIGQYSTANFTAAADGVGGATIIDPPVTTSAAIAQPLHG